jgi:hypothetical protein
MTRLETPYGWNRRDYQWSSHNNYWTASVYFDENGGPVHMSWVPMSVTKENFDRAVRELIGENHALSDIRFNGDRWDAHVKRVGSSRERKQVQTVPAALTNYTPTPFPSPVRPEDSLKKHEIRDGETNALLLEFHGQVPRIGDHYQTDPILLRVTNVLWKTHENFPGTLFAVIYVRRTKDL